MPRRACERHELVHLGIESGRAPLEDDPEPAGPPPGGGARERVGGVLRAPHPEHHLEGGPGERGERREVLLERVVHPTERLQDGDRGPRARLRNRLPQVAPQREDLNPHEREAKRRSAEEDQGRIDAHRRLLARAKGPAHDPTMPEGGDAPAAPV